MKIAVISFDVKYIEMLKDSIKDVEILPFGDTISFLKDVETHKPDVVIYDTTSGIFAEDDLRYLLNKEIVQDKKIFGLISADNPIDLTSFEGKVLFFDKFNDTHGLVSAITSLKSEQNQQPVSEEVKSDIMEEPVSYRYIEERFEPQEQETHIDSNLLEFGNLEDFSETLKIEEPSFEIEQFHMETPIETLIEESEDIHLGSFDTEKEEQKELEFFEEITLPQEAPVSDIEKSNQFVEKLEHFDILENANTTEKVKETSVLNTETSEHFVEKPEYLNVPENANITEKLNLGGDGMVANFNIQISEDEIKRLALQVAREFLERDPAMEKIVDHLQIDFQEEARQELDNLKNELKEQLRKEAESMMMQEIERLIKEELKDYVADITARIVKEKLEQIFKSS